jgi:hypothetical protein
MERTMRMDKRSLARTVGKKGILLLVFNFSGLLEE